MSESPRYVRYESTVPHKHREGVLLGIFATVNTLAKQGRLSPAQEAFRKTTNQWFDANMPLPTDAMPALYTEAHPRAVAWFKRTAITHLAQVPGYLAILDDLGVEWNELVSDAPGEILYEDAFQVVAVPLVASFSQRFP